MIGLINHLPTRRYHAEVFGTRPRPRLGCSNHERRVAAIAVRMFDLMSAEHNLGKRYRDLLHVAALVHDAAKPQGAEDHEVRGAQLVLDDRTLRVLPAERRAVAFLVRYHRGEVPAIHEDEILERADHHRKLLVLLAFLRAADALDSRRLSATALIIRRTENKLRVQCLIEGSTCEAARLLGRPRKFRLLEKTFGLRVRVRIESAIAADEQGGARRPPPPRG